MTAYDAFNGTPCAVNSELYSLLRTWGFNGHVTSDCEAIGDRSSHYKVAKDNAEAEAMSINPGLSLRGGGSPQHWWRRSNGAHYREGH